MDSIINALKPTGMTSHAVVNFVRKQIPGIKVGHTGTLDPGAAGVLPLCLGKATRISAFLLESKKGYRGEITFGITTDTLDGEGNITSSQAVEGFSLDAINHILTKYVGEIEQTPPAYSAVHYKGQRMYKLARRGEAISPTKRRVTIFSLNLIDYFEGTFPRIIIDVECSHGTYIRSLAQSIGEETGWGAHLSFLVRTFVGDFTLHETIMLEELKEAGSHQKLHELTYPMDYPLKHLGRVIVSAESVKYMSRGNYLRPDQVVRDIAGKNDGEELRRIYDAAGSFWGLGKWEKTNGGFFFKPEKVLRSY